MRRLAIAWLHSLARRVIRKYHPLVVGVTGSYGKTSAKEAIAAALSEAYVVRKSPRSYNNELGVPLTILGVVPGRSGLRTVLRALRLGVQLLMTRQPYPTMLVLEFGDDRPGDLKPLLDLVKLDVGVLTSIGPTHLQHFQTVENVFDEEKQIITGLQSHAWAVLNCDDLHVRSLAEVAMCRIVSYGFSGDVAVRCLDAAVATNERGEYGMAAKLAFQSNEVPIFVPGIIGEQSLYSVLAGVAVGIAFKLDLVEIADGLRSLVPPPGRMRVLKGMKGTHIIDDTYNSSPDACVAALDGLRMFPVEGLRYAILGEMADLGAITEAAHRGMAQAVIDNQIDVFVAVGDKMKLAAEEAKRLGMNGGQVFTFDDPESAVKFFRSDFRAGDAILVKGSQVSRMEKAVKRLMLDPQRASELLVRQDAKWLNG